MKRRRRSYAQLQVKARSTMEEVLKVDIRGLHQPGVVTKLQFPGLDLEPGRGSIDFIGRAGVLNDFCAMLAELRCPTRLWGKRAMVVSGPRGAGKTCLLWAVATGMYKQGTWAKFANNRLVCFWNMEDFGPKAIRQAFYFTFCQDEEAMDCISRIETVDEAIEFVEQRREEHGEHFFFIADGAERIEACDHNGVHRSQTSQESDAGRLFAEGLYVIWGISGRIHYKVKKTYAVFKVQSGFDEASYAKFMESSFLGKLLRSFPEREQDVEFHAAKHPWFLDMLSNQCLKHMGPEGRSEPEPEPEPELLFYDPSVPMKESSEDELAAGWGDGDWDEVFAAFAEDGVFQDIRMSVRKIKELDFNYRDHFSEQDIIALDPRYAFETRFCSGYVSQLYREEFRNLEAKLRCRGAGDVWIPYCQHLLARRALNWSEIGWLCDNAAAELITGRGIRIGSMLNLSSLALEKFRIVAPVNVADLAPNAGRFYSPWQCNFKSVDGVVVYKDAAGVVHFIGLQITSSVKSDLHSEGEFMHTSVLEQWLPGVQSLKNVRIYFMFLTVEEDAAEVEEWKPALMKDLKKRKVVWELEHYSIQSKVLSAFGDGLQGRELEVLKDVVNKREADAYWKKQRAELRKRGEAEEETSLDAVVAELMKRRRAQLDWLARLHGLTPRAFPSIRLLVDALAPLEAARRRGGDNDAEDPDVGKNTYNSF